MEVGGEEVGVDSLRELRFVVGEAGIDGGMDRLPLRVVFVFGGEGVALDRVRWSSGGGGRHGSLRIYE